MRPWRALALFLVATPTAQQSARAAETTTPTTIAIRPGSAGQPAERGYHGYAPGPPGTLRAPGEYEHDGLSLRLGLGVGWSTTRGDEASVNGERSLAMKGGGAGLGFELGYTVSGGLVLGAEAQTFAVESPTLQINREERDATKATFSQAAVGPFLTYYFDPLLGIHVHAFAALAQQNSTYTSVAEEVESNASGIGLGAALGYDFWFAKQWSAGVQIRALYVATTASEERAGIVHDIAYQSFTPSVQFGALLH